MANTISTSTNALATSYSANQLVAMSASGDALVFWYDGAAVKWSYAASPYSSWTTASLITSIGARWQAGIYKLANDNVLLVTSDAAGNTVSYLFTYNSGGHSWSAGSPVTVLTGGGDSNGGSVAMDMDAQGRIWAAWSNNAHLIEVYQTANNGTSWTASTTFTQVSGGADTNIGLAYCGNYIVCVFCAASAAFNYSRIDAHGASLGSWSGAAAVTNCNFDNTLISSSFRGAPNSNYGVFVGDLFAAIPAQYYNANTDTWSTLTNIGAATADKNPTLVTDGTNLFCVWSKQTAANNFSLVYKKWVASTQTWDGANTQLEANGTNISWANGGYGFGTLAFVYTVGTANPWSVNFDTKVLVAQAPAGPYVPHQTTYTGRGIDSTLVTQAALWYIGRGMNSTLVTHYITRGLSSTLITPITRAALTDTLAGIGTLTETFTLATALSDTIPGVGTLAPVLSANVALSSTTIPGVGTLTGALSESTALSTTLAGVGTLTGALSANTALSVTLPGVGTLTGTAALSTALTAECDGIGTLTGTLSTSGGVSLSVTIAGVGTLTGTFSLATNLTDTIPGVGTLTGTLSANTALAATIPGIGTLTGTLTESTALTDTIAGVGTLTGTMAANTALTVTMAGVGTLTGTMSASGNVALSTTMAGVGTLSATMSANLTLPSTSLVGVGTLAGTLSMQTALGASLSGAGTLSGVFTIRVALSLTFAGMGTLAGAITIPSLSFLSTTWVIRDLSATWATRDSPAT